MRSLLIPFSLTLSLLVTAPAWSESHAPHIGPIQDFIDLDIRSWLADPVIVDAINAQNEKVVDMAEADIIAMDNKWRAETDATEKPMIDGILSNALSQFLMEKQDGSAGLISEIFVMDAKGMNVGQSAATSDYWQGDEAKWQKTYLMGPDAIFIDEAEVDDSSGALQSQASISITDPASGQVIGAVTIGVNLSAL